MVFFFQGNLGYSVSKSLQLLGIFLVLDYISGGTIQVYWYPTFLLPELGLTFECDVNQLMKLMQKLKIL